MCEFYQTVPFLWVVFACILRVEGNGGIDFCMFFSGLHRFFRILKIAADIDGCMEFKGARQDLIIVFGEGRVHEVGVGIH